MRSYVCRKYNIFALEIAKHLKDGACMLKRMLNSQRATLSSKDFE